MIHRNIMLFLAQDASATSQPAKLTTSRFSACHKIVTTPFCGFLRKLPKLLQPHAMPSPIASFCLEWPHPGSKWQSGVGRHLPFSGLLHLVNSRIVAGILGCPLLQSLPQCPAPTVQGQVDFLVVDSTLHLPAHAVLAPL